MNCPTGESVKFHIGAIKKAAEMTQKRKQTENSTGVSSSYFCFTSDFGAVCRPVKSSFARQSFAQVYWQ